MKITVLHFEQLFPTGVFANQRLRAEATIDEGDNITDCYKRLQQEVENAFVKLNPQINWGEQQSLVQTEPPYGSVSEVKVYSKEQQILNFKEAIMSCKTLKALELFKKLVDRQNNQTLTETYDNKLKTFSNGLVKS